uniref:Uncharacterized protein n=1 Tax=Romanomermis culicivorax TaxID=13658 RepID=A0A915HK33_ROMCU
MAIKEKHICDSWPMFLISRKDKMHVESAIYYLKEGGGKIISEKLVEWGNGRLDGNVMAGEEIKHGSPLQCLRGFVVLAAGRAALRVFGLANGPSSFSSSSEICKTLKRDFCIGMTIIVPTMIFLKMSIRLTNRNLENLILPSRNTEMLKLK